ncbi:hypothetical protein ACLOJK_004602 [Asimina triloba]
MVMIPELSGGDAGIQVYNLSGHSTSSGVSPEERYDYGWDACLMHGHVDDDYSCDDAGCGCIGREGKPWRERESISLAFQMLPSAPLSFDFLPLAPRTASELSNQSREFLEELASQLKLQVSQIEISNFYAVGFSSWNITINVAPHTRISFSSSNADKMNSSLSKNKVHLDPSLVGDYKLLNFTWFKPPVPSPGSAKLVLNLA